MERLSELLLAAEGFQDVMDDYEGPCLYQGEDAMQYYKGRDRAHKAKGDR